MKKIIFFAITLILSLSCATSLPTFADDDPSTITSVDEAAIGSGLNTEDVPKPGSEDSASNPVDEANENVAEECLADDCPDAGTIEHEGTSGEPLVVCADENEAGCESSDQGTNPDEAQTEPELWPMWVSLGVLGAMIILVIIINIAGGKRKK